MLIAAVATGRAAQPLATSALGRSLIKAQTQGAAQTILGISGGGGVATANFFNVTNSFAVGDTNNSTDSTLIGGVVSVTNVLVGVQRGALSTVGSDIMIPDRGGIAWLDGSSIWGWNNHNGTHNELQFDGAYGMAFRCINAGGADGFQMGGSGPYHDHWRLQYDTDGTTAGMSKFLSFVTKALTSSTLGYSTIRAVQIGINDTSNTLQVIHGFTSQTTTNMAAGSGIGAEFGPFGYNIRPTLSLSNDLVLGAQSWQTPHVRLGAGADASGMSVGGLDIAIGNFGSIKLGAEANVTTRTDTADKIGGMVLAARANAQVPHQMINAGTFGGAVEVDIGGGSSAYCPVGTIGFYAASGGAINTPGAGNLQMTIIDGAVQIKTRFRLDGTVTAAGTTTTQTINKPSGTVNFPAAAATVTVNNSLVTVDSIITCVVMANDTTALLKNVVPSAGSFVIRLNANTTAETKVGFVVHNPN